MLPSVAKPDPPHLEVVKPILRFVAQEFT